jgi:hypothetical protein
MFLLWAQQWHYALKAIELGKNVLRMDSDVYFTEDPYPILHGPLFSRFHIVAQTDVFHRKVECSHANVLSKERHQDLKVSHPPSINTPPSGKYIQ